MNSFIWGSKVVIIVSTELRAFSATLAKIDFPGIASFIHPKSPEPLLGRSLRGSRISFTFADVGLSRTQISKADVPAAIFCCVSFSVMGEIGRRIGRFKPWEKKEQNEKQFAWHISYKHTFINTLNICN